MPPSPRKRSTRHQVTWSPGHRSVVTFKDGEEVHSSVVRLEIGTDQAMGVLRGEPGPVHPDKDGTFESTFTPCGVTTHGSTETDHVCTQKDVDESTCPVNWRWRRCTGVGVGGRGLPALSPAPRGAHGRHPSAR
ncbi:hypothetical protein SAVIM40S_03061 [Streptomyces avidinii]